jgi:hypothetical protein
MDNIYDNLTVSTYIPVKDQDKKLVIERLIECYTNKRVDDYQSWLNVGITLYNELGIDGIDLFLVFSKKSNKYNEIECCKKYMSIIQDEDKDKKLKLDSMHTWAQIDDMKKYNELFKTNQIIDKIIVYNNKEGGEYIYNKLKNKITYTEDNVVYFKVNNIWINNTVRIKAELENYIMTSDIYKKVGDNINCYSQNIKNVRNIASVVTNLVITNGDNTFYDKIHKTSRRKLCFLDGVLDIPTKVFIKWNNIPLDDQVYSTICINRNYNPIRDERVIQQIYDEIFMKVFGKDTTRILQFFSRAIAGEINDKIWASFICNKYSNKDIIEQFLNNSLGNYVNHINSGPLLLNIGNDAGTDSQLKYSWMYDIEFSRIIFSHNFSKGRLDGTTIKEIFCSRGDKKIARKTHKLSRKIHIDGSLFIICDDYPEVCPIDTLDMCLSLNSTIKFVNKDHYDRLIKEKIEDIGWCDALIHLLLDNYTTEQTIKTNINNVYDINTILMKYFQITYNKKDIVTNNKLEEWWKLSNINVSLHKIKTNLISLGAKRYKSDKIRGLRNITIIEKNIDNNNDEYIYLIHTRDFFNANKKIYKIGRTEQKNLNRIKQYPNGSSLKLYTNVHDNRKAERELINIFKQRFIWKKEIGNEYFEGSLEEMKDIINKYAKEVNSNLYINESEVVKNISIYITQKNLKSTKKYPNGSSLKLYTNVYDCYKAEKELLDIFRQQFIWKKEVDNTFFEGSLEKMKEIINNYVKDINSKIDTCQLQNNKNGNISMCVIK